MKVESDGQEFNRYLQKEKMTSQRKSLNTKKTTTHADGNKGPVFWEGTKSGGDIPINEITTQRQTKREK